MKTTFSNKKAGITYIVKIGILCICAICLAGCHKDDDPIPYGSKSDSVPTMEEESEIVLASADYTNANVNNIPDIIFINDGQGKLIDYVDVNGMPQKFELKGLSSQVNGTIHFSSYFQRNENARLETFLNIKKGTEIVGNYKLLYQQEPDKSIDVNITFPVGTDHYVDVQGLRVGNRSTTTVDNLVNASYEYRSERSGDKLLIIAGYKDLGGSQHWSYVWVPDYRSLDRIAFNYADLFPTTTVIPTLNASGIPGSVDIDGLVGQVYYNLNAPYDSSVLKITNGFDAYLTTAQASYEDDAYHMRTFKSVGFQETFSMARPNWEFSYELEGAMVVLHNIGDFQFFGIEFNNDTTNKRWAIIGPGDIGDFILPEFPEPIPTDFTTLFEPTMGIEKDVTLFDTYDSYENLIKLYTSEIPEEPFKEELAKVL